MSNTKKLPDTNKLFFTSTGFGIKSISRQAIINNLEKLKKILKDAREFKERGSTEDALKQKEYEQYIKLKEKYEK